MHKHSEQINPSDVTLGLPPSGSRLCSPVVLLLSSQLDLLGHCVEVCEQKPGEFMHLIAQSLISLSIPMDGLITVKPKLVRPLLQGWSDFIFRGQLIDSLFQRPRLYFWRKCLQSQFHRTAIPRTGNRVQARLASACRLFKCPCNVARQMLWNLQNTDFREYLYRTQEGGGLSTTKVPREVFGVNRVHPFSNRANWPRARWALEKDVPPPLAHLVQARPHCNKTKRLTETVRAVVKENSHA